MYASSALCYIPVCPLGGQGSAARAAKDSEEQVEGQVRRLGVERTFALQKQRHGLRRTQYRGLSRVRIGVYLNVLMVNIRRIEKLLVARERRGRGRSEPRGCLPGPPSVCVAQKAPQWVQTDAAIAIVGL